MHFMILTNEERNKFCEYLRKSIESRKLIGQQYEKLSPPKPIVDEMNRRNKTLIAAETIVLQDLESAESQTIGG